MTLSPEQADRASGVLLAHAVGDALGVPYEFATPPRGEPEMIGGGLGDLAPGEWSDDTQVSVCIARVAATGADLTSTTALDAVAAAFEGWLTGGASDVGIQTRAVLEVASRATGPAGIRLAMAAREYTASHPHSAGNGALMRTSIVGLTRLDDREHTAAAARAIAELTHADPLALQAAWAAITTTDKGDGDDEPTGHVRRALTAAVHAGDDTDTVAAIAGGLLGARYGASAVPVEWASAVHGWPGLRGADLVDLGRATAQPSTAGQSGAHPPGAHAPRADR